MNAPTLTNTPRSIGDILVATGRLSAEDAERIVERQQHDKLLFGESAMALKVLTQADIDFALSRQFDYAYLMDHDTSLRPEIVAAYRPFSHVGEQLRAVRSQLMLRWAGAGAMRRVLAVVSPGEREGRSFIAANLAVVFAQQGERTLLIDACLRAAPQRAPEALFKLVRSPGLSGILAGRNGLETAQIVPSMPGLVVLPAGTLPPNPQELLGRAAFVDLLQVVSERFDVVIVDTPAATEYSDAEIIAARTGAALLVVRKHQSRLNDAAKLARRMQDSGVVMMGSVLNYG